ncbi:MAG: sensor histidine kinase [Erythrobacter sp.]
MSAHIHPFPRRMNFKSLAVFVFAVLIAAGFFAAMPVAVMAQQEQAAAPPLDSAIILPIGNAHEQRFDRMRYLIIDDRALDPIAALSRRSEFEPILTEWLDFGDQEGSVWLLMQVHNNSGRAGEWIVDIQRPFVDELIVQKIAAGNAPSTLLNVDQETHFDERPIESQYLVAPLWMEEGERAQILVGMRSSTGSWMPVTFATAERMRTAHMQEARFNWVITGAMLALMIVALAMGRLVGWRLSLAFGAYVGFSALFVANNEGYLHRFVWPDAMWLFEPVNMLLLVGIMLALLQFARLFSELPSRFPRINRVVLALQIVLLLIGVVAVPLWQSDTARWIVFAYVRVVAIAYFVMAWLAWRGKVLGAFPFVIGSLAILFTVMAMTAVLIMPGRYAMTVVLDYFHATVLFETMAFFIAIVVRMLAMQRNLNRSLQAEVVATQEKLAMAEQLQQSRSRYDVAREKAEAMRARLASTSHDLQQPILSLRQDLRRLADRDEEASGKLAAALDYLEAVTNSGLEDSTPQDNPQAGEKPDEGTETFAASVVLDNCAAMFRAEAETGGVELHVRTGDIVVHTDPVALMRAVSNLISNALKHASPTKVLVSAKRHGDHVAISVIDNGRGMSADEIRQLSAPYAKGADSEGHGLGMALVREFAQHPNHDLRIRSRTGGGTAIALHVPSGA